jgi:hypothetical protein
MYAHGDPLSVNGSQVGILKERDQVRLRSLLERHHRRRLEPQVGLERSINIATLIATPKRVGTYLEILRNLTHKALERELTDEQLCGLLVPPDLAQCDSAGTEAMRLLHTTGGSGLGEDSSQSLRKIRVMEKSHRCSLASGL